MVSDYLKLYNSNRLSSFPANFSALKNKRTGGDKPYLALEMRRKYFDVTPGGLITWIFLSSAQRRISIHIKVCNLEYAIFQDGLMKGWSYD